MESSLAFTNLLPPNDQITNCTNNIHFFPESNIDRQANRRANRRTHSLIYPRAYTYREREREGGGGGVETENPVSKTI